ncbi:MAG: DUF3596 domain-containing protein [Synechococcales cyanobacterium CRU_2_2]|nr:DUF3596 domain-containing protein [Synechococcales cyanobacterium CRU_2_2]
MERASGARHWRGSVKVQSRNGYLSLRWSFRRKRYQMALGNVRDTDLNQRMAQRMAQRIEDDITTGNFDPTLRKYRPNSDKGDGIATWRLMDKFQAWKARSIDDRTLEKYRVLGRRLQDYWGDRGAANITPQDARDFRDRVLRKHMRSERTINETTTLLSACWQWARRNGYELGDRNPWDDMRLRVPPSQGCRPFTLDEMQRILQGFENGSPKVRHYADFVKTWAFLGARTGEMRALRWRHITDESCSQIWIGETLDQSGNVKSTKNQKDSFVDLPEWLSQLLRDRRGEVFDKDDLIFQSPEGNAIEAGNFNNRIWRPLLKELGIKYRRPYNIRHTSISHNAEAGLSEADAAQLYRTSIPMIRRNYRGSITDRPVLKDWLNINETQD